MGFLTKGKTWIFMGIVAVGVGTPYLAEYAWNHTQDSRKPAIVYKEVYRVRDRAVDGFISNTNPKIYSRMRREIIEYASNSSKKYYLPTQLVIAMMRPESEFNTFAVSNKNAVGLMQINWQVWKGELSKAGIATSLEDLYDPKINIEAGCYILRKYIDQTKDLKKAIYKYLGDDHLPYYKAIQDSLGLMSMIDISMEVSK